MSKQVCGRWRPGTAEYDVGRRREQGGAGQGLGRVPGGCGLRRSLAQLDYFRTAPHVSGDK